MYVVSQIFVIISSLVIGSTYFVKDKTKILYLCLIYCIFYGVHYLLLGAVTGFLMTGVSFLRNLVFYVISKNNRSNNIFILIILIEISLISGISGYQDVYSIVSICASLMSTYSIWQDNVKVYRILSLPISLCFVVYALHFNSIMAIVSEGIIIIMEIIGIIDLYKNKKIVLTN